MIQTPSIQTGSRLTWAELRELYEREEQERRERGFSLPSYCEAEAEREGRKLFQRHLSIALLALLLPALVQAQEPPAYLVLDPALAERVGTLPACPDESEAECLRAGLVELLEAEEALLTLSDAPTEDDPAVWNAAVRHSTEDGSRWQRVLVLERCR